MKCLDGLTDGERAIICIMRAPQQIDGVKWTTNRMVGWLAEAQDHHRGHLNQPLPRGIGDSRDDALVALAKDMGVWHRGGIALSDPKIGDLEAWCVWFQFPRGRQSTWEPVNTPKEGYDWIEKTAAWQAESPNIEWNFFGLEVYTEDGWKEWYDEEGRDVDEAFDTAALAGGEGDSDGH